MDVYFVLFLSALAIQIHANDELSQTSIEKDTEYWIRKGEEELGKQLRKKINLNTAKNVIFFLGDGMSIPTMTGARVYKAEKEGKRGGEGQYLSFEKFPYSGLSRTYCVDHKVADSACSSTAFLRGVKANSGTLGVNARVARQDCDAARNQSNRVDSIAAWSLKAGKSAGFVTMTKVTDATPAGTYAYSAERDWESDVCVKGDGKDPNICEDIASQMILRYPGKDFKVLMGGGEKFFIPNTEKDEEGNQGYRNDGKNLIKLWIKDRQTKKEDFAYVWNRSQLLSLKNPPDYLLGFFNKGNLDYTIEGNKRQPSLAEMTEAAIRVLQKNSKGYFLLVEGGIIDTAHHQSTAHIAFDETLEFSKAIEIAVNMTKEEDTLIVVTADHAHTMSLSGYPNRYNSIFGFSGNGLDKKPHTTINYADGPGFNFVDGKRRDMSKDDTGKPNYKFPSGVPLSSETHGGDDVAVFARGPHSHLFTGSYEESYIAIAMAYASGLRGKPST